MTTSIENDLEELLSCAICLGTLLEPKLLPCSHRFCKLCIIMEMDRSASPKGSRMHFPCPLCKREIELGKGKTGVEWIVNFETDRLLKDIQDLLQHEKEDSREKCLSHKTKLALVCYSCGTTGCYVCAWQNHRSCHDVQNFKTEARKIKLDLQKHLEEIEICINKIVPYVTRWSSARKSLKNQRDYSNRFIEERLKHLKKESVLAVEGLKQDYGCYITRSWMSKDLEKEIRRLMETFPEIISGKVDIVNIQSRLQRQNETIIFPQIQEASLRLESTQNVQLLISTVENIKKILDLGMKDFVLRGRDLLTQKSTVLSKAYREKLTQKVDTTSPKVVQDSLVTKPEQIDLGNAKDGHVLRDLKTALRTAQTPKELVEKTGWLCFPGGYHPKFVIDPANDPLTPKRRQVKKSKRRQPQFQIQPKEKVMRPRQSHASNSQHIKQNRSVTCNTASEMYHHERGWLFSSYNSLHNKANPEPFPALITIRERVIPKPSNVGPLPAIWHHFDNTDDEEEGLETARFTLEEIGNGFVLESFYSMSYERENIFTVRKAFKQFLKVVRVSAYCCLTCIILHICALFFKEAFLNP